MLQKRIFILALLIVGIQSFSQNKLSNNQINKNNFDEVLLQKKLLKEINTYRENLHIGTLSIDSILQKSSESQADFMAQVDEVSLIQSGKAKTTKKRIVMFGGSAFGEEIVSKYNLKKAEETQSYDVCAREICQKWANSKKTAQILLNPKFTFTGLSIKLNDKKNKLYLSIVLGNYKSLENGAQNVKSLKHPFSKKKCGFNAHDDKICKKIDHYKKRSLLQKGLSLEDGIVYFQTDDYKSFKKIIRGSKDGIALDIVQKQQYLTDGLNIVDNTSPWKGIVSKPVWAPKLEKTNMFEGKEAKRKLKAPIAELKNEYGEDIELNLLLIQDKHVCASVMPNYTEDAIWENSSKVNFLADTITINSEFNYKPIAEHSELVFKVPFKRTKSNYQKSDIEPIIKSLNEPDFIINKIEIEAYSSIEGRAKSNKKIQKNRAKSIETALKNFISTNDNISKAIIKTDENWVDFCRDVKGTKYEYLSNKTIEEARQIIKQKKLWKGLEPILAKHRYARIKLSVTYNIEGNKEEKYVLNRFNKAVEENDKVKALSIQKYIFKKVLSGDYSHKAVTEQKIPDNKDFAGIKMNWYWLMKYTSQISNGKALCDKIHTLYQLVPNNQYLMFNDVFCQVRFSNLSNTQNINNLETRFQRLYETKLPEQTIKNLHLKYLFSVINAIDTTSETSPLAESYLLKIKELVNIKEVNQENALSLAYLFMEHQEHNYAAILLEPFLNNKGTNEELLFTYISLATHNPNRIISNYFYDAVKNALNINKERLQQLFSSGRISVQVLENLKVKQLLKKELDI